MISIKNIVSVLWRLSVMAAVGDDIGLVCQKALIGTFHVFDKNVVQNFKPVKAMHASLAVLLSAAVCALFKFLRVYCCHIRVFQAAKGASDTYDGLLELLESIEHFLKRLDVYTKIPPTPAMDEMVVKIMVELLSTLALATKEVKQGRPSESLLADVLRYSA